MAKKPPDWVRAIVVNPKQKAYFGSEYEIDRSQFAGRNPDPSVSHAVVCLLIPGRKFPLTFCVSELVLISECGARAIPDLAPEAQELLKSKKAARKPKAKKKPVKKKPVVAEPEDDDPLFQLPKKRRRESL
jgi:hypothetical protein